VKVFWFFSSEKNCFLMPRRRTNVCNIPSLGAFTSCCYESPKQEARLIKILSGALPILIGLAGSAAADDVVTYHNSQSRNGAYKVPGLTTAAAATMKLDTSFNGVVSGAVYAQPLYWAPKGGTAELIVATESNIVYALDPSSGAVLWARALPTPAPSNKLGCGDINPEGITGTPVIDPKTGTLYVDAMTYNNGALQQQLYGLSLTNGTVLSGWPLDVDAAITKAGGSFTSKNQGERSALLMFKDNLYAVYGGRDGDCPPYRGTVIQVDPTAATLTAVWQTRAAAGGIWAQGGIASEGTSLYVTTGNTQNAQTYGDGESIIQLKPGLARPNSNAEFYAPANWQTLDNEDLDLGGTEALPVNVQTVGGKKAARVISFGKDGNAYLVNRNNLGGVGGKADIVNVSSGQIKTGPAVYSTPTADMVAITNPSPVGCSETGIMMLKLAPSGKSAIKVAWCAAYSGNGSPIITTTDGTKDPIVWVVGASGDNLLHGFDAKSGKVVFAGGGATLSGTQYWGTILAADGHFYIAAANKVYAFTFTPG
jgi:hypothetical protein